jgi:effector-binding domain-containing protein
MSSRDEFRTLRRSAPGMSTDVSMTEPVVITRAEQPYAAITGDVTMPEIGDLARRTQEVFDWLAAHGVKPAGAPFLRYLVIDMERTLRIQTGVPVGTPVTGSGDVHGGVLPAGRYLTATHTGHPDRLEPATGAFLDWAAGHGLEFDHRDTPEGDAWECRLEVYQSEPDVPMDQWVTDLVFRLADPGN